MAKKLIILLFLTVCANLNAQTYKQVLQRSSAYYKQAKGVKLQAVIYAYDKNNEAKETKYGEMQLHKRGKKFKTSGNGHEMLCDGKQVLTIDHRTKRAVLFVENKKMLDAMEAMVHNYDTTIQDQDSVVRVINTATEIGFKVFKKTGMMSEYEVVYNKKNYALKKFTYRIRQNDKEYQSPYSKMKIEYTQTIVDNVPEPEVKLDDYITKEKGKYILRGKYSKYKLSVE